MQDKQLSLKDVIRQEYVKCAADPVYFMRKYCKIQHPTKGKLRFELFPYQEKTLIQFKENRYNLVLKSRHRYLHINCRLFIVEDDIQSRL